MPVTKSIQRSTVTVSEDRKKERSNHQKVFDKKKDFLEIFRKCKKEPAAESSVSKVASVKSRLFLGILFS